MTNCEKKAVIFDMDGTLLDTLLDIAISNNNALTAHGFPTHDVAVYRNFVGNGIRNLVRMSLPPHSGNNSNTVDLMLETFKRFYKDLWHKNTVPYPGIPEMLDTLEKISIPKSIVTNKSHEFAEIMVTESLGRWSFDRVVGEVSGKFKKPDPSGVHVILSEWGLKPECAFFIGDSVVDMMTARNSGIVPVAVTWGFEPTETLLEAGALHVLEEPDDLIRLLE